ncbi:cutinase family protein, partial [Candidatus Saccharibacteria bacterium]|nr:cutinase family protein [Candidatus Saccharibacteria bacterium]
MSKKIKTKVRYIVGAISLIFLQVFSIGGTGLAGANSCPDVMAIFARGSGGERWTNQDYLAFRDSLKEKLKTTSLSYEFIDLDYPAIGLDFSVTAGAIISGGEAYQFGESVEKGVAEMTRLINSGCSNTKYVIGGYSQGAMVVIRALGTVDSNRILYAATFGDPKLYLPEGYGPTPAA